MGSISSIAFLVFLVMAIVSWAKKNGKAKKFFICSGSSFVLMLILVSLHPTTPVNKIAIAEEKQTEQNQKKSGSQKENIATRVDDQQLKPKTEAQKKAEQEAKRKVAAAVAKAEKIKNQQLVIGFEKKFYSIEEKGSRTFDNYSNVMGDLAKGQTDIYTIYSAAQNAKNMANGLSAEYYRMQPSKDLPKEVRKLLKEASLQASYSYSTKADALDNALQFFDEQKPSLLQNYEDRITLANQQVLKGTLSLMKAKLKVGLDATKVNK